MKPLEYFPGSLKKAGFSFFAILLLVLFSAAAYGNTIVWSSGSFEMTSDQCSSGDCSNDTLVISGSTITSSGGKALDIASGCDGLTCVFTGKTIYYSSIGISIHADDIRIVGGTFLDTNPGGDDHQGIKPGGDNITLKDVSCMVAGDNAIAVYASGGATWNLEIDGGTYWSTCTGYESRCNYDAPVIKFSGLEDTSDPSFLYHAYVHDITITDGPWAGITGSGRSQDGSDVNLAIYHFDNNTIQTDAQNDWYSSYSGLCKSSANPYGIVLRHVGPGSRIQGNTITSGSDHRGNRGILVERGKGTSGNPILIRGNTIDIHEGKNVEFPAKIPVYGIRVRYANKYVLIDSNFITVTSDNDNGTLHTGRYAHGMELTIDQSYSYITVRNNRVVINSLDTDVNHYEGTQAAIAFNKVEHSDHIALSYNNLSSSEVIYQIGEVNSMRDNGAFLVVGDTITTISPENGTYQTIRMGYLCNPWENYGSEWRDVVYKGSTSPTDVTFSCGGTGRFDAQITRTLNLYARGSNGLPVGGVTVTARNGYGQTVVSGTTDNGGRVSGVVTYHYDANGWFSDSTAFNNFTLTASMGGDSDANNSFTVGWTRAGGTDTLTLSSTVGTGEWGAVDPEPPDDTTPPAAITDLNASTGSFDGSIGISWTAPGDDGNTGIASLYRIRYSTSTITESNWSSATSFGNPPLPTAAGTSQSTTVSGLVPGVTYYIAIKTIDDYGNVSPLSNAASAVSKETTGGSVDQIYRASSWTQGLTHGIGSGDDRLLLFTVAYESGTDPGVGSVTYGGRSLTRIGGIVAGSGAFARVEMWYLNEGGISAASNNSFSVTWGSGTPSHPTYGAVTYRNVNQINPILDVSTNATDTDTPNPITTSINVISNGMAVAAAMCGNLDPYAWNNGWSEGIDQSVAGTADLSTADHQELASGTSTASATNERPNRQAIIAVSLYPSTGNDPTDTTPPAPIMDLGAEPGGYDGTIDLTWTASGDDGSTGRAFYYIIRYSTQPISDANWGLASLFPDPPPPISPGAGQWATLTDLVPGTFYYIGIKSVDDNVNQSELSNIASATSRVAIVTGTDDDKVTPLSPNTDFPLNTSHPTLVVANIDTQSDNLYYFEVATDSSFASLAAVSPAIPEESGNTTAWKVQPRLAGNRLYFWRARADDNPYSDLSSFTLEPRPHAYPNPFMSSSMDEVIFAEIPSGSDLVLMQVSGSVVRRWDNNNGEDIHWDGTNESGSPVASGTYLWFVKNTDQKGKLIVLR